MSNRITEKLLFSPTNIPGCTLWLDAADPNTVIGTSPVTNWKDKSGKGYDLSSSGGTPQYVNYGPGMSIYLNNAYLAVPSIAGGVNLANYSFFIVSLSQTAVNNQTAFSSATPGVYNYNSPYDISFFIDSDSGNQQTRFYSNGAQVLNSIPTTTIAQPLNLMSYTGNSAGAFSSWVNGNTGSTNASGARASGTTSFSAGGNWNLSAWVTYANVVCNLYEVVVYTTVLTTAQRQQVEGYLTWKWGLQGSLPSNHPYKNLAPSFPLNTVTRTVTGAFSPTSISGLTAWFDGSDPAGTGTPPSNGASISTWVDKSGNARNAVAGGAPTFAAASQNGLGTLTFNGTTNYLYASGLTVPTNTHSLFAVHNPTVLYTPSGSACLTGILRAQESVGYIVFPYGGALDPGYGYTTSFIPGYFGFGFENDVAGAWNLYETVVGSSAVIQYQYGTVVTSNSGLSITATTSDNFTVGSYSFLGGSAQQFYLGSMAEILVFNVELSTGNRQIIEGYLAWKWGRQTSLSPSHPYYSAAPTGNVTVNVPWTMYNLTIPPPFSPTNIAGLQLWLDGADPNANSILPSDSSSLNTWVNKASPGTYNATIASGRTAAVYSTSYKAVNFNSSNNGYVTSYPANPTAETMFVVANISSASINNNTIIGGQLGARSLGFGYSGNGGTGRHGYLQNEVAWLATTPNASYTSGTTAICTGYVSAGNTFISANGGTFSAGFPINGGAFSGGTTTYLGVDTTTTAYYFVGYAMEILFYNSVLTTNQIQTIQGYLAWKWGIQASLPPSHPYYSAAPLGVFPYSSISNRISVKYFSPLSITGTQLWLDAVDPYANGVSPTNGASISTWRDKSGIGNNGTANTGVIWAASGMGPNLPGFTFTNSQWFLGNISITGATMTVFGILSMSASSLFAARMIALAALNTNDYNNQSYVGILRQSSNNMGPYRNANYPSVTFSYDTPTLLSTWYDGTNANISANGGLTPSSSGSSGNFSISSYAVAANTNLADTAAGFYGYISEIIVYNVSLTTAQRQTVEGYLAWKWRLQANLPSRHPFRNYPPPP